jgi:cytochrome P450
MATATSVPTIPARALPRYRTAPWRVFQRDRIQMLRDWAANLGPERIGCFQFLRRSVVLIDDPALAGELLLTRDDDFHKGPALSIYSRPLLGSGLLTSEGDFHRRQRRLAAPAFAHRRVASYAETMTAAAEAMAGRWTDGQRVDVAREMMRLTLGIVGKTLFDAEHTGDEADAVGQALTTLLHYFTGVVRSPFRLPFSYVPPWQTGVRRALAFLDQTIYALIRERRQTGRDAGDLLSMLLLAVDESGETMDDRQIRDEAMTIFLAGHETTANALAWTWHLLAAHPAVYDRVCAEADAVLTGRAPTYADLADLPYTLQVFKESLRLYPPAYVIARQAQRETVIGGFRIPAKTVVFLSPYLLHRHAETYPDPERFDPDRWADPEREKLLPRHAYLPFGGGPRICIGAAFALMEGHLVLAALAQRVRFTPATPDPIACEPLITLRPRGAIPMIVSRRDGVSRREGASRRESVQ